MKNYSLWFDNISDNYYPKLNGNITVDVLIISGGITGNSIAYHLINNNLQVCLVERNKIGEGISARTTGKITFLQGNIYSKLLDIYSYDVAKKYYESQKEMHIDFDKNNYNTVQEFINDIVWDNNNYRPSYALNYKTPIEYKTQLGFQ